MEAPLVTVLLLLACGSPERLADQVSVGALEQHIAALQAVADAHGGTRAAFTSGYDASTDLLEGLLEEAGYEVLRQEFSVQIPTVTAAAFTQVSPVPTTYVLDGDGPDGFSVMAGSPTADVTAALYPVDLVLPPGEANSSTSGCEPADFSAMPEGAVALIQRGTCAFRTKVALAQQAGAAGVLIFNEGQSGRTERLDLTAGLIDLPTIPSLSLPYALGADLAAASAQGTVQVRMQTDIAWQTLSDDNLFVQTPGGDDDKTILVGAHLDSVPAGPGLNDNGSGSSLVLELALLFAEHDPRPRNTVRFAWWGAEELGLIGSYYYKQELAGDEQVYLNFDMVGTPDGVPLLYAGNGPQSTEPAEWEGGSLLVGSLFEQYLTDQGVAYGKISSVFSSDNTWWLQDSVTNGGLFTGLDACYHEVCDTEANVDLDLLGTMTATAGHTVQALAELDELTASR